MPLRDYSEKRVSDLYAFYYAREARAVDQLDQTTRQRGRAVQRAWRDIAQDVLGKPEDPMELALAGALLENELGPVLYNPDDTQLIRKPGENVFAAPSCTFGYLGDQLMTSPIQDITEQATLAGPANLVFNTPANVKALCLGFLVTITSGDQGAAGQYEFSVAGSIADPAHAYRYDGAAVGEVNPAPSIVGFDVDVRTRVQARSEISILLTNVRSIDSKLYPYNTIIEETGLTPANDLTLAINSGPNNTTVTARAVVAGTRLARVFQLFGK